MASEQVGLTWPQLSGCTEGIVFSNKKDAEAAISHLSTCSKHNGCHHFAVAHEGRGIAMSTIAEECLREVNLI